MKIIASCLFVLLLLFQVQLWFGNHGVFKLWNLEQAIEMQIAQNQGLEDRNRQLRAQVIELQQGKEALEDRARSQLGFIKDDETFYRILPAENKP